VMRISSPLAASVTIRESFALISRNVAIMSLRSHSRRIRQPSTYLRGLRFFQRACGKVLAMSSSSPAISSSK
jgi:hypothetical protein